jgi:hypothetical protein
MTGKKIIFYAALMATFLSGMYIYLLYSPISLPNMSNDKSKFLDIPQMLQEVGWSGPKINEFEVIVGRLPVEGFYSGPYNAGTVIARAKLDNSYSPPIEDPVKALTELRLKTRHLPVTVESTQYDSGEAKQSNYIENDLIIEGPRLWFSASEENDIVKKIALAANECAQKGKISLDQTTKDSVITYSAKYAKLFSSGLYPSTLFHGLVLNTETRELYYLHCW